MASSAVIVNHQVMLGSSKGHSAIGGSRLLYIANRPGAVAEKTDDDLRIEAENERMAKLGYIEFRPGSVHERNGGHALFDQTGVPERAEIRSELKDAQGAIITSVVSVRREEAEALGLQTKQDWERFLRAHWANHIESMGVIERENIRWVAAMHCNQVNNYHCHVFTWDASGGFDELIPKKKLVAARDELVSQALRPRQEEINLARTQARDELVALLRERDPEAGHRALAPREGLAKVRLHCQA